MKRVLFICAGVLLFFQALTGQHSELRPDPPKVLYVDIDPETNFVTITWLPSPTPDLVNYYYVGQKSKVVINTTNEISQPIFAPQYSYPITSQDAMSASESYSVKGVHDLGGGDRYDSFYDTHHNTIFLEAFFDSCHSQIDLNWNNYSAWSGSVDRVEIKRRIDAYIYVTVETLTPGATFYELDDLDIGQTYDLFIQVFHTDGRSSRSNMISVDTRMTAVPSEINADYATINESNGIDLSFTIIGNSPLTSYRLLRSNSFDGPYTAIDSFRVATSKVLYTDPVNYPGSIYFYKLEVLNNCFIGAIESNRANNLVLNGTLTDLRAQLEWNAYRDWRGGVANYRVTRTIGRSNPVTEEVGITSSTFFNDDISNQINYLDPAEALVCYTIKAEENTNSLGITGESESNKRCFPVNIGIQIPNAFIPNDTEAENQVFAPVFPFLPEHYELIIYNRLGSKIWEGTGPWDGKVNGKYVSEGVYVYYLKIYNYSSEISEYKGMVTVVYR